MGYSAYEVAPATLAATFLTSIGGIVTYQVLQATHGGAIAPDWALGAFLGAGGFTGGFTHAAANAVPTVTEHLTAPVTIGAVVAAVVLAVLGAVVLGRRAGGRVGRHGVHRHRPPPADGPELLGPARVPHRR